MSQVMLDRILAEIKLVRDVLIASSAENRRNNLYLARRHVQVPPRRPIHPRRRLLTKRPQNACDLVATHPMSSGVDASYGLKHQIRRRVFAHHSTCAELECLNRLGCFRLCSENDSAHRGRRALDVTQNSEGGKPGK